MGTSMWKQVQKLLKDESGVISVEYAVLAGAAATVLSLAGIAFYDRLEVALESISLTDSDDSGSTN